MSARKCPDCHQVPMMAGQWHGIVAICPKCRCLWQVNDEPAGSFETWTAEADEMFAQWAAPKHIPLSQPKCEFARTATARRWRMWNPGLLV